MCAKFAILIGLTLLPAFPAFALLFSPSNSGPATITGLSLSNASFAGGAVNGTTIGNVVATTSDGSTPTLTLSTPSAGLVGSGYDGNSFQVGAGTYPDFPLETNTSGGTDQPGQYHICITASGSYSNSPQQICPTIQASGPGGTGWQLTFSDEFSVSKGPGGAYMLNWQNQYAITSYTWSSSVCSGTSGAAGCGVVTTSAATNLTATECISNSSVSRLGACTVSITGATNSGSGGAAAVNGNFLVVGLSADQKTLTLYMPYSGIGTIGLGGGATLGTGPWTTTIVNSSSGTSNPVPTMLWHNNENERWDSQAVSVGSANGLTITTSSASFTDPTGGTGSSTTGHIQTWNGTSGFSEPLGNGYAFDFYGSVATQNGTSSIGGLWPTFWALSDSNLWPGSGSKGGEIDAAEYAQLGTGSCATRTSYDIDAFDSSTGTSGITASQSPTFAGNGNDHQYTVTNIGGTLNWYLDSGTALRTVTGFSATTDGFYPVIDVEYPSYVCSGTASLPTTTVAEYVRVYEQVNGGGSPNNACYSSIPTATSGTIPHTGAC